MAVMFWLYVVLIAAGIAVYAVVGQSVAGLYEFNDRQLGLDRTKGPRGPLCWTRSREKPSCARRDRTPARTLGLDPCHDHVQDALTPVFNR